MLTWIHMKLLCPIYIVNLCIVLHYTDDSNQIPLFSILSHSKEI